MKRSLATPDRGRDEQLPASLSVLDVVRRVRVRVVAESRRLGRRLPTSEAETPEDVAIATSSAAASRRIHRQRRGLDTGTGCTAISHWRAGCRVARVKVIFTLAAKL